MFSCCWDHVSPREQIQFDQAIDLLPTCSAIGEYNRLCLSELPSPIVLCKAKHNCDATKKASDEDAEVHELW